MLIDKSTLLLYVVLNICMNNINVPNWYCANIHAGLKIVLDSKTGEFLVSTCSKSPVLFSVTDNISFEHPELIKFRNLNLTEKTLPGRCSECDPVLCQNGTEVRSSSNQFYIRDQLLVDQTGPTLITFLVSVICNLACATCVPAVSSKWAAISKRPNNFSTVDPVKLRNLIRNIDLSCLETIHIFGGEPFADGINDVILEELAEYGKNITVWYDNNGTFIPSDKTMRLWEKFRLVRLKYSIDGVDESFEYLRWPAKWEVVSQNIIKMVEIAPSNVMFSFRPAIGLLNLHKIKDIQNWFSDNLPTNKEGDLSEFEYNGVYGIFTAKNMTEKMKIDLLKFYPPDNPVTRIINSWEEEPSEEIKLQIQKTLFQIDATRGTDYKKSLPYLNKYF